MKAKINLFETESPVKKAYIYRLPNGCIAIRLDLVKEWMKVDHATTHERQLVQLNIQIWSDKRINCEVDVTPVTKEEVELFSNAYFLQIMGKHRVIYYVVPKLEVEPEELVLEAMWQQESSIAN